MESAEVVLKKILNAQTRYCHFFLFQLLCSIEILFF